MKDDLFNDIIDPYESSFKKGEDDGREAALKAGYDDGYQLGKLKALEIGIELGYMSSICTLALQSMNDDLLSGEGGLEEGVSNYPSRNTSRIHHGDNDNNMNDKERKRKRIIDLLDAIEAFPKPDTIFHDSNQKFNEKLEREGTYVEDQFSNGAHADVASLLQRLRAKFKTILVQLGLSHLRLKSVMDGSIKSNNNTANVELNSTTSRLDEW